MPTETTIEAVKIGDFFTLNPIEEPKESQVFTRFEFCQSQKKYTAQRFSDFCDYRYFSRGKKVYVNFTF